MALDEATKQGKVARIAMQLAANLDEVKRARDVAVAETWPAAIVNSLDAYAAQLKAAARARIVAVLDGTDATVAP